MPEGITWTSKVARLVALTLKTAIQTWPALQVYTQHNRIENIAHSEHYRLWATITESKDIRLQKDFGSELRHRHIEWVN